MLFRFSCSAALLAVSLSCALAAPITVNNASFETANTLDLACTGTGCLFNIAAIPGWTNTGSSGTFQPGIPVNATYFSFIPDGNRIAYSNGPTISQTVAATVAAGTLYTLEVEVGNRADFPNTGNIALQIGTTVYAATPVAIAQGGWSTFSVSYLGSLADAGQSIAILLTSTGEQGNFDNVRLDGTVQTSGVPEPATGAMLALGLAGALFAHRRNKR